MMWVMKRGLNDACNVVGNQLNEVSETVTVINSFSLTIVLFNYSRTFNLYLSVLQEMHVYIRFFSSLFRLQRSTLLGGLTG